MLSVLQTMASVAIKESAGWFESAFVTWQHDAAIKNYHVYYRTESGTYMRIDPELVRDYGTYGRADIVGIKAGKYQLKVIPLDAANNELTAQAAETQLLEVKAHDRSGFAHFNYSKGIGAYNNDGTLKTDAQVFYITASNAKTIEGTVDGIACKGFQQLVNARQKGKGTTPLCFRILGTVEAADMDEFGSSAEGLQIKGKNEYSEMNITIEGIGNDAAIRGFGMLVRNSTSVELRNFAVMLCLDDCLSFDTNNSHCWAHHIDFFYGKAGSAADQVKGDGSLDCKTNSQYMTFSYNHFWDSGKMSLCGMKSESGENFITYHHNWFDHSDSRHPRVRTMTVHVYNNYFDGISKYGVGATTGANVFVENNYFRNTGKPMLISLQGSDIAGGSGGTFSGETGGMIKSYGNVFAEKSSNFKYVTYQTHRTEFDAYEATARSEKVPADIKTVAGGNAYNNFDTDPDKMYTYTPDKAADIPTIVQSQYGAGRMQHGDFQYTFTKADDTSHDVDNRLKTAITDYQPTLVAIMGGNPIESEGGTTGDGGTGGGDEGGVVTSGEYECHFTDGEPSSKFYTIAGNYSDSKGTATVNGNTYTWCLKMESATNISFTLAEELTILLVFAEGSAPNVKIDGQKVNATNGNIIEYKLAKGSHTITKADSNNLFYINMKGGTSTGLQLTPDTTEGLIYDLMGRIIPQPEKGQVYIQNGKKILYR